MKELALVVREKIIILFAALLCFGTGVGLCVAIFADSDTTGRGFGIGIALLIAGVGVYCVLAYFNHRLKVFADGSMVYSSTLGKKIEFRYSDLTQIEQRQIKGTFSLTFIDRSGKRIGKVEGNMKGYEEFCQWLNTQKKKAEEAEAIGIQSGHGVEITPVNGGDGGAGIAIRILMLVMGLFMLVIGILCVVSGLENDNSDVAEEQVEWFDIYTDYGDKRKMEVEMISYAFANFELSDSQELYFIFDTYTSPYIVCMDNERFATEFADIYEYTFSDSTEPPRIGMVEGYAMEIDEELKAIAIEEFNYLWNSEILTEENFEDYLGCYYLDTTYIPESEEENPVMAVLTGVLAVAMGAFLIYSGIKKPKKETADTPKKEQEVVVPQEATAEAMGLTHTVEAVGEIPVQGNLIVALLASIVCASAGAILWVVVYKLGRITYLAGLLAVVGAIFGYSKIGKRELTTGAGIWCIVVGLCWIGVGNYISYAWEIMDAVNASNPGRTDFIKVLTNMPWLMQEMELWGSFLAELGIGIVFALLGGVGSLFGNKKK